MESLIEFMVSGWWIMWIVVLLFGKCFEVFLFEVVCKVLCVVLYDGVNKLCMREDI